jgi:putative transcriptional regulator
VTVESLRGCFLVADPKLLDPNFARTVVLLVEHEERGALGLVLNRPTDILVADAVPALGDTFGREELLYAGGPVGRDGVMVLAEFDDPGEAALVSFGDIGLLPTDPEHDLLLEGIRRARVFAGHAGWGPGQLDAEVEAGGWFLVPATPEHVFSPRANGLWSEVLAAQGGSYALIARMPIDPSLN